MKNYIELRAHHLLCLPGYKGHAYNKEHSNSWARVSQSLKQYPDIRVKIVSGRDTLCTTCPNNETAKSRCNETILALLDNKVKMLLNLTENITYRYEELQKALKEIMTVKKHETLCGSCHWRIYGLCKDTFKKNDSL